MATSPAPTIVIALGLTSLLVSCIAGACHDVIGFGYGKGPKGPDHWGSLKPEWKTCSSGSRQSPIDILEDNAAHNESLEPLTRDYADAKATLVNNGFNVELRYDEGVGTALVDGTKYSLQQVHWHAPSEHTVDGERFPLEMHMVHRTGDGKLAVVAILYRLGRSDRFAEQFIGKFKELAEGKCGDKEEYSNVSIGVVGNRMLRRSTRKYYRYVGSLTAPPCREEVIWTVLGEVREITQDQLAAILSPLSGGYRNNSRPLQPLKGRTVQLYKKPGKNNGDLKDGEKDKTKSP